jgi:CheY-like chemotaxis protein
VNARILVVEDDPDAMRLVTSALSSAGYQVVSAYGGEDAIRKLGRQKPDLVLTDLAMPTVSGVEVIKAVKKLDSAIPVLAITAYTWEEIAQAAGQAGCDGYVSKPFTAKYLVEQVQRLLKRQPSLRD